MKKLILIISIVIVVFALAGCGKNALKNKATQNEDQTEFNQSVKELDEAQKSDEDTDGQFTDESDIESSLVN